MNELLVVATIARERFAFRAADIHSVIELDAITPVPQVPDFVAGIAALRSRPLTVIDAARSLEIPEVACHSGPGTRSAVVVERDRDLYALLVDQIEDVVAARSEISPPSARLDAGWQRAALGMVETADSAVLLVDPAVLIAGPAETTNTGMNVGVAQRHLPDAREGLNQ